jgi:hypothetical protein
MEIQLTKNLVNIRTCFFRINSQWNFFAILLHGQQFKISEASASDCVKTDIYDVSHQGCFDSGSFIFILTQGFTLNWSSLWTLLVRQEGENSECIVVIQVSSEPTNVDGPHLVTWPSLTSRRQKSIGIPQRETLCQKVLESGFTR